MAERFAGHALLTYMTFVLPIVLLGIALLVRANVFLIIIAMAWLGVAFIVLFLPIESDDGSSS